MHPLVSALSPHGLLVCVSMFQTSFSFLTRVPAIGWSTHSTNQDSLTWDTHLLPNKGTSTGTRTETSLLGRHSLTYSRYGNSQRDHKLSHFNSREPCRQKSLREGEKTEAVMNYLGKSNQFLRLNLPNSMLFLCGQKRETVWNLKQEGEGLKTRYFSLVTTVPFSTVKCLKAPLTHFSFLFSPSPITHVIVLS